MTAISIDRLLSLLLGIRYRQIVTLKRVVLIVVALWVMSLAGASSVFFRYSQISVWYGHILIALCLVISTFSYAKIYQTLHQLWIQIQHQVHRDHLANRAISPLNMARYKIAVSTTMWIQLILAVCYIPQAIVAVFLTQNGLTSSAYTAGQYVRTDFNFPELIIKPFLLLLEDWRSQASSKEQSQANLLFSLLICIYWKCSFIF